MGRARFGTDAWEMQYGTLRQPPMIPNKPPPTTPSTLKMSTSSPAPHVRQPGEQKSVSAAYDPHLPAYFRAAPGLYAALQRAAEIAFPQPETRPTAVQLIQPAPYVPARPSPAIALGVPVVARKSADAFLTPGIHLPGESDADVDEEFDYESEYEDEEYLEDDDYADDGEEL